MGWERISKKRERATGGERDREIERERERSTFGGRTIRLKVGERRGVWAEDRRRDGCVWRSEKSICKH